MDSGVPTVSKRAIYYLNIDTLPEKIRLKHSYVKQYERYFSSKGYGSKKIQEIKKALVVQPSQDSQTEPTEADKAEPNVDNEKIYRLKGDVKYSNCSSCIQSVII